MHKKYFPILIIFATFILCPPLAWADEISINASKALTRVGDEFIAEVSINSREAVNAVDGSVSFRDDLIKMKEIRYGNSVINFWVEKPHLSGNGTISFSGITPGGFEGTHNVIFSIVFEALKPGVANMGIFEIKALLNDGDGTEAPLQTRNGMVVVKDGDSTVAKETIIDHEPPEDFKVEIVRSSLFFDNKYVLLFETQDKISGIKKYEVREGKIGFYRETDSPYLLRNQKLTQDIYVRAVDNAGNKRMVSVPVVNNKLWYEDFGVIGMLFLTILLIYLASRIVSGYYIKKKGK